VFRRDVAKVDSDVAHIVMVVHLCCKLLFSMFHLFFSNICCKCIYLDVAYVFKRMMQVFYLDEWMLCMFYDGFKCFSGIFASHSNACFICFHTYVAIVASRYFKTRSSIASLSSPFYYLASVSGTRRWRRSPLAQAGPMCLRANAAGETWAGRHETRDGGSGAGGQTCWR
jgi:hypothetical protein